MARALNKQISLKPQDVVVVLKVALAKSGVFTYLWMSNELAMSGSEVHASLSRAKLARLVVAAEGTGITPNKVALREFITYGVKYAFPAVRGSVTRGIPTAHAGPALRNTLSQGDELPPVWPDANGDVRGVALYPLYRSVPFAAKRDPDLYSMLTLIDALRIGAARERELATAAIAERFA